MLLLCPDDVLRVGILLQVRLDLTPGEGVQFLDACDGCVTEAVGGSVLDQRGVNLAGTEDDTRDLVLAVYSTGFVFWVNKDRLEGGRGISEEGDVGSCDGMAKKRFREEDDQCYVLLLVNAHKWWDTVDLRLRYSRFS